MGHRDLNFGVALVEVLLSVAVVAAALGVCMEAIGTCVRKEFELQQRAVARRLAEGIAGQLRTAAPATQANGLGGHFDAPFDSYSWNAVFHQTDRTLDSLEISVSKSERALYRVRTYVVRTSAPEP